MILYHGTSSRRLPSILENGIQPRMDDGNWKHTVKSKRGFVYLTDCAYAIHYAKAACNDHDHPVVLQVKVSPGDLYPDEDFIAQALSQKRKDQNLLDLTREVDIESYRQYAKMSLEKMGTCAVRQVRSRQILASCLFPFVEIEGKTKFHPLFFEIDPAVSIIHYLCRGKYFRDVMTWVFSEKDYLPDDPFAFPDMPGMEEYRTRIFTREFMNVVRYRE